MLDHHLQRSIIYQLAFTQAATFTELKAGDIDNKLFTYHLKKTINSGYVFKSENGLYSLTQEGRRLSTGVLDKQQALVVERPLSALFLIIRRKADGAWLLYKRRTHPMLGYKGFMHCRPSAARDVEQTAQEECKLKTGLMGNFTALGGGYIRIFEKDNLESFTHFTLLYCDDIEGALSSKDSHADYFWSDKLDLTTDKLFPATKILKSYYERKQPFFMDEKYSI